MSRLIIQALSEWQKFSSSFFTLFLFLNLRKKSLDIIELLLLNGVFIDEITAEEHMRKLPEGLLINSTQGLYKDFV